MKQRLVNSGP